MHRTFRRGLALLLCVLLCAAMFPMQTAAADELTGEPLQVIFECSPESAAVRVFAGDERIEPEEDGSYRLLPGPYHYTASAEGYFDVEHAALEVCEGQEQPIRVPVILTAQPNEEPAEPAIPSEESEANEAEGSPDEVPAVSEEPAEEPGDSSPAAQNDTFVEVPAAIEQPAPMEEPAEPAIPSEESEVNEAEGSPDEVPAVSEEPAEEPGDSSPAAQNDRVVEEPAAVEEPTPAEEPAEPAIPSEESEANEAEGSPDEVPAVSEEPAEEPGDSSPAAQNDRVVEEPAPITEPAPMEEPALIAEASLEKEPADVSGEYQGVTITSIGFNKSSVTVPGSIKITVKTESTVPVEDLFIRFQDPDTGAYLDQMLGNDSSGTLSGTLELDEYTNRGTYVVALVYAWDTDGYSSWYVGKGDPDYEYYTYQLSGKLASKSFAVENSRAVDLEAPTVTGISLDPAAVVVPGSTTIRVTTKDNASYADECTIWFRNKDSGETLGYYLYDLDGKGTLETTVWIDTDVACGRYYVDQVQVHDRSNNSMTYWGEGNPQFSQIVASEKLPSKLCSRYLDVGTSLSKPKLTSVESIKGGVRVDWEAVEGAQLYSVIRKTGDEKWVVLGTTSGTSYTDKTAVSGTDYLYSVRCMSPDGNVYISGFDKTSGAVTYIAAPVLKSAANVNGGVQVKWDASAGAVRYKVFRKTGDEKWVVLGTTTGTSYTDKTAVSGTTYRYTVRCVTADGKTNTSGYDSAGKTVAYIAAPVLTSAENVYGGVQVKWEASAGAVRYKVFRKTDGGSWTELGTTTGTSYTDKTAESGTAYIYTVRCVTADGKTSTSSYNAAGKSVTYIAAPVLRSAENLSSGVKLRWITSAGAERYKVFRKTGSGSWTVLGTATGTSYTDKTAVSGTAYRYTVRCVTADGKTAVSAYDRDGLVITFREDGGLILATPKLAGAESVNGGVEVKWAAVNDAAQYKILRKTDGGSWKSLAKTSGTRYTDTTAESGTTYCYTVRCLSADGKTYTSSYDADGKTVTYIAAPVISKATNVYGGVQVKWEASAGAVRYKVFRKTGSGSWTELGTTTGTSYTDKTAVSGTTYRYTVRCVSANGKTNTSGYDPTGKTRLYIAAPVLTKVTNIYGGVQVKWEASAGAERYKVFRKTGSGSWTELGTTTGTSYTDKTAVSGTTYIYTVRCVSADGTTNTSGYDSEGKTRTYIAAPTLVKVENVDGGGMKLSWKASAGAERYKVLRKPEGGSWTDLATTTGTSYTDTTGVSGQIYAFSVRCVSADGKTNTSGYDSKGKSLVCGINVPTEQEAYERMIAMKTSYPEGMHWTNDNFYAWKGGIFSGGYGCAGFAFLLSDAAFGNLPAKMIDTIVFDDLKVGDILRVNGDSHSVIILQKYDGYVVLAEGNYNSSIHWGRTMSRAEVLKADYYMTRYPDI